MLWDSFAKGSKGDRCPMLCLHDTIHDDDPTVQRLLSAVDDAHSLTAFMASIFCFAISACEIGMGFPQLGQRSELRIFKFCIGTVHSSNPYTTPSLGGLPFRAGFFAESPH